MLLRELQEEVFLRFGGDTRLFAARAALPSESLAMGCPALGVPRLRTRPNRSSAAAVPDCPPDRPRESLVILANVPKKGCLPQRGKKTDSRRTYVPSTHLVRNEKHQSRL